MDREPDKPPHDPPASGKSPHQNSAPAKSPHNGPRGFRETLRRAQEGDRSAMDQAIEMLRPSIEPLARRYADPSRRAESTSDLVQKSCLRAWEKIGTFAGGEGDEDTFAMFRAWMGQIIRRLGIQEHRKRSGRAAHQPDPTAQPPVGAAAPGGAPEPISPQSGPSTVAISGERSRRIEGFLDGLSDPVDTRIVRLHFFEELEFPEIAERVGLPFPEVRRRYRAAMRTLQKRMKSLP